MRRRSIITVGKDRAEIKIYSLRRGQWRAVLYDLLVKQVDITYQGRAPKVVSDGVSKIFVTYPHDTSDAGFLDDAIASSRVLSLAVELGTNPAEPQPPDGLAATLHAPFLNLYWDFEMNLTSREVDWSHTLGDLYNIAASAAAHASANGVAQQITWNIATGTTTLRCGAPSHLGLDDLLALIRKNRQRGVPSDGDTFSTGENKDDSDEQFTFNLGVKGGDGVFYVVTCRAKGDGYVDPSAP